MWLSRLREPLQWLRGGSVKVMVWFNWSGGYSGGEVEVLVVSGGNELTGVYGGMEDLLGVR